VVSRLRAHGIEAVHDYESNDRAVPLSETLTIQLGKRIARTRPGAHIRLYSDYSLPGHKDDSPLDDFEREALVSLRQRPEQPFYRFEEFEGRPSLRYAVAERVQDRSFARHDNQRENPQPDGHVGDARGVLEFIRPLDLEVAQGQVARQRSLFVTLAMAGLGLAGLGLTFLRLQRTAASLSISDATRKKAEEALAQRDAQLRQSQKLEAVGSLAGGIAHEFNNMLQAIRGYTEYGMEGLSADDPRYQDLEQVIKAADRAATLTRELLGFSRRQVLERVNLDPHRVVTDLIKMLRPVIGEHIDLQVSQSTYAGALHADPGQLQQMLLNLCINARDAMPDGGRLTLKTERADLSEQYCQFHPAAKPGAYLILSVADTGCGMLPEVKERIFEPFYTTKGVGKGTGLGLAMVYGCVQQHEGMINVYSEPGTGTTFKIYLPLAARIDAMAEELRRDRAVGGSETILVAEDEPMVRDLAIRILTGAGYSVLVAKDGVEAVEIFEANADDVSLALLDAVMPKLTGHQAYERIKLMNPGLPVVFCSGYDPETGQGGLLLNEGVPIVQKPFDPDVLLRTVREVLDAQHLEATPS
jgi:signal transduction histidine kinase/CheY-like chemotaxis protein